MKKFIKVLSLALVTVLTAVMLTACAPSNIKNAEKKMKNEAYKVTIYEEGNIFIPETAIGAIYATKGSLFNGGVENITAYLFKSSKDAKAYAEGKSNMLQEGKWVLCLYTEEALKDFLD